MSMIPTSTSLVERGQRQLTSRGKRRYCKQVEQAVGWTLEALENRRLLDAVGASLLSTAAGKATGIRSREPALVAAPLSPAQNVQLPPGNYNVGGSFNFSPGSVIQSDSDIHSDDQTFVEVAAYISRTSNHRGVSLRILYRAHESESGPRITPGRTVLEIDRTIEFYNIPSSDPRTISDISLSPSYYLGRFLPGNGLFGPQSFPSFGPLSNLFVTFDGSGGDDHLRMRITGSFSAPVVMSAGAHIAGKVFDDRNVNSVDDGGVENGLSRLVWIDANQNGVHDGGELSTTSDSSGAFRFNEIAPGNYPIRQAIPSGWVGTLNGNSPYVAAVSGVNPVTGIRLGQVAVTPVRVEAVNPATGATGTRLTVREGASAQFRFTRANAQLPPASVWFNVLGTADASDYQAGALSGGVVHFAANEASKIIELPITANNPAGGERQVGNDDIVVQLDSDAATPGFQFGPIGDYVRDAQGRYVLRPGGVGADRYHAVDPAAWEAIVEIVDVHQKFVSVDTADAIGFEGSGDSTSFRLRRNGEVDQELFVDLSLTGTAKLGVDYLLQLTGGGGSVALSEDAIRVRFAPNSTELLLSLNPLNDTAVEGIEWAHAELLPAAGYTVTTSQDRQQVRLSLVDDEIASVMLRASNLVPDSLRVPEAGGRARFTVDRGSLAFTNAALTANVQLQGGATTTSAADYVIERVDRVDGIDVFTSLVPTSGGFYAIALPPNVPSVELALRPVNDAAAEADELVEARLISGEYLSHPTLERVEMVLLDDDRPTVAVAVSTAHPEAREGGANARLVFTRGPAGLSEPLTARYRLDPSSTALYGVDYRLRGVEGGAEVADDGLSVTFAAGQQVAEVELVALADRRSESGERAVVHLLPFNGYEVGASPTSATVFITDAASGTLQARWDWSMPEQYGLDENHDGRIDLPNTDEYAARERFPVRFDASQSVGGIANYSWSIDGPGGEHHTDSRDVFTIDLKDETTYTVKLKIFGSGGSHEHTQLVHVNNILILGMGDSYAAGEGSPDERANNIWYRQNSSFGSNLAQWADGLDPTMSAWHHAAHRSEHSQFSKVALDAEAADPKTSVTFVNVAQSGAEILNGVIQYNLGNPLKGKDDKDEEDPADGIQQNPTAQLPFAKSIVGDRKIDKLMLSIGGNDIGFSNVLKLYLMRHKIQAAWGLIGLGHTVGLDDIRDSILSDLSDLPYKYAALDQALRSTFAANEIDGKVFLAGYPFPLHNEYGGVSGGGLRDNAIYENGLWGALPEINLYGNKPGSSQVGNLVVKVALWFNQAMAVFGLPSLAGPPLTIDETEAEHARVNAAIPLERAQRDAASSFGWNFVEPSAAWKTKGYPAAMNGQDSFFRTIKDARQYQGGNWMTGGDGAFHPTEEGYRAYADQMNLRAFTNVIPTVSVPQELSVVEGGSIDLSASIGSPNLATVEWDLNFDGTFAPDVSDNSATFSAYDLSYGAARQVVVRVTDTNGRVAFGTTDIRVTNGTSGRYAGDVQSVNAGEPFRLGLQRIRAARDAVNHWRIDWGDGSSESVAGDWKTRTHVYELPVGTAEHSFDYRVWLTDAGGEIEVQGGRVLVVKDDPFPRVGVQAIDDAGDEQSGDPIRLRFTRTGQTNLPLSIAVAFSDAAGRAINGLDFAGPTGVAVPLSVYFPVGQSSVDVYVYPVADADEAEGAENVDVTILPSSLYALSTPTASGVIADGPSVQRGAIEGVVFEDADGDRIQDVGEAPRAGWSVALDLDRDGFADAGEPVAITDATGRYVHALQPAGDYQLILFQQSGFLTTSSAVREARVLPGEVAGANDFAVARAISVDGRIFADLNLNGIPDAGEAARANELVWADLDGDGAHDALEPSTFTDASGEYHLAGVRPGHVIVRARTTDQWVGTNGVDGGGLAIVASGGDSVTGVNHGQRRVAPNVGTLTTSAGSAGPNDRVVLTAQGVDAWASLVNFYRESNGTLGLQTGSAGDLLLGSDATVGDGWTWSFRPGLAAGGYLLYAAADDGLGSLGSSPFTFLSVNSSAAPTQVGVRQLTAAVREGGSLRAVFEVYRTGINAGALSVTLSIGSGTGLTVNGVDHDLIENTIVLPAGQDAVRISLAVPDDESVEGAERIRLAVESGSGYAIAGAAGVAEILVRDASTAPAVVSVLNASFDPSSAMHVIEVALSENVASAAAFAALTNLTTGQPIAAGDLGMEYDSIRGVARFAVPSAGGGTGTLSDGSYRLTLLGSQVVDAFGRMLDGNGDGVGGDDFTFEFSVGLPPAPAPTVAALVVNGGAAQRSRVTSLTLTFDQPVTVDPAGLSVTRRGGGSAQSLTLAPAADGRSVVVTFAGAGVFAGSLADGLYDIALTAGAVRNSAGQAMAAGYAATMYRLFGDRDGNGTVNVAELGALASAYGSTRGTSAYDELLDVDDDGLIGVADLGAFASNYGKSFV